MKMRSKPVMMTVAFLLFAAIPSCCSNNTTSNIHKQGIARPFVIGLCGGIASGKSTAAAMLSALGAVVIDSDRLAHNTYAPGTQGLASVIDCFGPQILDSRGSVDRTELGRLVFGQSSTHAKAKLEAIVWPLVRREIEATIVRLTQGIALPLALHDRPGEEDSDSVGIEAEATRAVVVIEAAR